MIPDTDIAYLAAVLDVNGRLYHRNTAAGPLPMVEVNLHNPPLMEWLRGITKNAPFTTARDYQRFGCSEHCADRHIHTQSISQRWSITGGKATIVLHNVMPYLFLRRDEASALLEMGLAAEVKRSTVAEMTALGWDIPDVAVATGRRRAS